MSVISQDQQVVATTGAKAFLTQMTAALQHLALATVHLYVNNFTPTAPTVAADFDEPDTATEWAEYVPKATTGWGPQETDPTGRVVITATPLLVWVGPAVPFAQTVYGYFILSAQAGTPLLYSSRLPVPKNMTDASKVLTLAATFTFPNVQVP